VGGRFLRSRARPPIVLLIDFVGSNKDDIVEGRKLGVELICRVLRVAPITYYGAGDRVPVSEKPQ